MEAENLGELCLKDRHNRAVTTTTTSTTSRGQSQPEVPDDPGGEGRPALHGAANEVVNHKAGQQVGLTLVPLQVQFQAVPLEGAHLLAPVVLLQKLAQTLQLGSAGTLQEPWTEKKILMETIKPRHPEGGDGTVDAIFFCGGVGVGVNKGGKGKLDRKW